MNEENDILVDFNEASGDEQKLKAVISFENINEPISNSRNSYFIIYYDKRGSSDIRAMLSDKIMKLNKFASQDALLPAQEKSKNIYFLFLDVEKKLIKAIMKKDYIKSDKNLKLETKIK
jgi:hypothetical protein